MSKIPDLSRNGSDVAKFKSGKSGNPAGRPKGLEDKRVALRRLLEPHAEELVNKVVEKAKEGDMTALRLCLDRLIPPVRARDVPVTLQGLSGTLAEQGQKVFEVMAQGNITPTEAASILQALGAQIRLADLEEIRNRLKRLEARDGIR